MSHSTIMTNQEQKRNKPVISLNVMQNVIFTLLFMMLLNLTNMHHKRTCFTLYTGHSLQWKSTNNKHNKNKVIILLLPSVFKGILPLWMRASAKSLQSKLTDDIVLA